MDIQRIIINVPQIPVNMVPNLSSVIHITKFTQLVNGNAKI